MGPIFVAVLLGVHTSNHVYKDPAAPIPDRVADLLAKMTTEEKVILIILYTVPYIRIHNHRLKRVQYAICNLLYAQSAM